MKHSLEYSIGRTEMQKIENLVDEVCEKHRLNETYFGNILMAITSIIGLIEENNTEKETDGKIRIEVQKDSNLLVFFVFNNGMNYNFKKRLTDETFELNEEKEAETIFLIRALCDEIELSEEAIKLIFDLSKVLEPILKERKKEFEKYYSLKRIEV
jgi:hypothetical protein